MTYTNDEILKFHDYKEVVRRLLALDFELKSKGYNGKLKFVIFGGTAFMFYLTDFRATKDIDVYYLERQIQDDQMIMMLDQEYRIRSQVQNIATFPVGFEDRLKQLNIPFEKMEVYLPAIVDLICTKAFSERVKDEEDILDSGILDYCDLDQLRLVYQKTKDEYGITGNLQINLDVVIYNYLQRKEDV